MTVAPPWHESVRITEKHPAGYQTAVKQPRQHNRTDQDPAHAPKSPAIVPLSTVVRGVQVFRKPSARGAGIAKSVRPCGCRRPLIGARGRGVVSPRYHKRPENDARRRVFNVHQRLNRRTATPYESVESMRPAAPATGNGGRCSAQTAPSSANLLVYLWQFAQMRCTYNISTIPLLLVDIVHRKLDLS